jgi:integrase
MAQTMATVPNPNAVLVGDAVQLVIASLEQGTSLAVQTQVRTFRLIRRFGDFVQRGFGLDLLDGVTDAHVMRFVGATTRSGRPSVATMRLRRWSIRLFFRTARDLGLTSTDPTIDVVLPARTNQTARPLTTAEVERCRLASLHDLRSTRLSVAWALGEASARTAEIPHLCLRDLDLEHQRVWIHGSAHTAARHGPLTAWGADQLHRRVRELGHDAPAETPLAHIGTGNAESRVSFSAQGLRETLTRAGLAHQAGVHPASLAGWVGGQILEATGKIEAVAIALGVRSLDTAARIINWTWRDHDPEPPDG